MSRKLGGRGGSPVPGRDYRSARFASEGLEVLRIRIRVRPADAPDDAHRAIRAVAARAIRAIGARTSTNPGPFSTDGRLDHSANYAALLWRIENGVDHGFTSGTLSTTPTSSGELQFRINDSELGDNPGAMTITMDYTAQ